MSSSLPQCPSFSLGSLPFSRSLARPCSPTFSPSPSLPFHPSLSLSRLAPPPSPSLLFSRSPWLALPFSLSSSLPTSSFSHSPSLLFYCSLSPHDSFFSLAPLLPRSSVWNAQHDRSLNVLLIIGCPCADKLEEHIRLASWVR